MITAAAIRAYQDTNECGMMEAKAALIRRYKLDKLEFMRRQILHSSDWRDVKDVVEKVIDELITDLI